MDPTTLTPHQQLALVVRVLAHHGYDDKLAGHVSLRDREDGTLLVNPYGLFWHEVRASEIIRVDVDGHIVEGPRAPRAGWTPAVNPSIVFHTELHLARHDIVCAIHSHPSYGSVWAAANALPPLLDQTGGEAGGKAVLYDVFEGAVMDRSVAAQLAINYGDADMAILAKHGTLVTASTAAVALVRALAFERRCKVGWQAKAIGYGDATELRQSDIDELTFYGPDYARGLFGAYARWLNDVDPLALAMG
jgi:ribulose-5-phosphate 4-epimerase/fuculose-1-phosphate aldolase